MYGQMFSPYMQQFQPNFQPPMPSMQPQMQPIQQQTPAAGIPSVVPVATLKQVEQAPVQPGGKVLVLVSNEPVIAMRTADNMGITTTDYYKIERFDPDSIAPTPIQAEYVTRAEFQQFVDSIRAESDAKQEKEAAKK